MGAREPNKALQQTGHAIQGSARHNANFRVSRLLSLLFGEGGSVFKDYYHRRFAELGELLTDADGLGDEAVAAALTERRLVIPAALSDYYTVAGRHWINRQHNRLYPIGELAWQGEWLVFMEENQCVTFWGIWRADAGAPDPVVWQAPNAESLGGFAEPYRVSQFLMAMWRWQLTGEQEPGEAEPGAAADRPRE